MQEISKSQGCSSRYPIKWKWRTLALSKTKYSYCCFQPTWPPISGLFIPPQLPRNILQTVKTRCSKGNAKASFPSAPFSLASHGPCGLPQGWHHGPHIWQIFTVDRASTRMRFWSASRASICFKINNNPSLFQFSVPKIVLIFCQSFLFILQALQRYFI